MTSKSSQSDDHLAASFLKKLRASGLPKRFQIDEQHSVVVQDADAYAQLVEDAELAHSIPRIQASLDHMHARDEWIDARKAIAELAARHGIALSNGNDP